MKPEDIRKAAVIGTGMIGCSLATMFAGNSCPVVLIGRREEGLASAREEIGRNFDDFIARGLMTEHQKEAALALITFSLNYDDLKDVSFIMEAVNEDVQVKAGVYAKIEAACPADAVIASATSALSADVLADQVQIPSRFLVAHPWNPPHLVPLVEIVKSRFTDQAAADLTRDFLIRMGKKPVVLQKNIEGFVGNRLQHAMLREALYLLEQGIVSAEEINDVVLYGFGPRYSSIGPLEHYDCAGLPLQLQVQSNLFPTLCNADGPQKPLLDCLARGELGMKTNKGILDWSRIDAADFRERQRAPYYKFAHWNFPE